MKIKKIEEAEELKCSILPLLIIDLEDKSLIFGIGFWLYVLKF